jgi:hypothetical protein
MMVAQTDELEPFLDQLGILPEAELLVEAVASAVDLALNGRVGEGYQLLLKRYVLQQGDLTESFPWTQELLAGWQHALATYERTFAIGRA